VAVEGMDLAYSPEKKNLLKRPFTRDLPANAISASSLYQEGMELKEGRQYEQAGKSLKKCLEKDPLHIDAMVALAELSYRSNRYDSALYYTGHALQLDTYHPAANYYAGITYRAQGDLINALESLGWAARSMEYRSVAYAQMAAIHLRLKNADLAEHYANQSLDYNQYHHPALKVLAVLYREQGNREMTDKIVARIRQLDPLNHFANFEQYLLEPAFGTYSRFSSAVTNEFPYQTYLELCMEYIDLGRDEEALLVLDKAPEHPLVILWKAFLKKDDIILLQVINASPAFVFPFRTETATVLEWAMSKNDHWKFRYYLALNYWAIQRGEDAARLFRKCGEEPDYAPFYLTRAFLLGSTDRQQELNDLLRAYRLAPDDWRASNKLIGYYEKEKDFRKALSVATTAFKKFPANYTIGLQYAKALLNTEQYIACIKILDKIHILPFEGSTQGREVYEQAHLAQARKLIETKKYRKALVMLGKSEEWPENLGVGKPYNPDTSKQDSLKTYCLKMLKTPSFENGNH
jgi:tetratricopeptide (TPR) repeat protein